MNKMYFKADNVLSVFLRNLFTTRIKSHSIHNPVSVLDIQQGFKNSPGLCPFNSWESFVSSISYGKICFCNVGLYLPEKIRTMSSIE